MPNSELAVLIIAAGNSSRLGQPKQLIPWRNTTLLGHAISCSEHISSDPYIVLGASFHQIKERIEAENVIEFPNWELGMGASISFGLERVLAQTPEVETVLIIVCDQPYISIDLLKTLVSTHQKSNQLITACIYDQVIGVPAIFSKEVFSELLALDGNKGARAIIADHQEQLNIVPFPGGSFDIDTPEDMTRLLL